jgi:hypothetical protein
VSSAPEVVTAEWREVAVEGCARLNVHPEKEDAMSTPAVPDSPPPSAVSTTPTDAVDRSTRSIEVLSILVIIAGAIFIVAGVVTWFVVRDQLADEKIVVSDDAERFGGWEVDGPFTAYAEADAIEGHALESSGGQTYAQLDREDPTRETVMTASFLRSSLFTSVVAFGVAFMAAGLGLVLIGIGVALLLAARRLSTVLAVGAPMPVATST